MAEGGMVYVGGLWKSQTKNKQNMLSGTVGKHLKVVILPNKNKTPGDNKPDANMFFANVEREDGDSDNR